MRYLIDRGAAIGLGRPLLILGRQEIAGMSEEHMAAVLESRVDELSDLLRKAGICPQTGLPQTPGEGM